MQYSGSTSRPELPSPMQSVTTIHGIHSVLGKSPGHPKRSGRSLLNQELFIDGLLPLALSHQHVQVLWLLHHPPRTSHPTPHTPGILSSLPITARLLKRVAHTSFSTPTNVVSIPSHSQGQASKDPQSLCYLQCLDSPGPQFLCGIPYPCGAPPTPPRLHQTTDGTESYS